MIGKIVFHKRDFEIGIIITNHGRASLPDATWVRWYLNGIHDELFYITDYSNDYVIL